MVDFYILPKLKHLSVQAHLLLLHHSIIDPVILYGAICSNNMLTVGSTIRFGKKKNTHTATKLIGPPTARISDHIS